MQGDQRILHALNRLTFGPRPGDLDVVRSMGLDHWFEQQLHSAQIDDSNLDARLAAYPAMQWTTADLFRRLPSNATIRQAIAGRVAVPETTVLHSVYQDAMYRMEQKKRDKAGTQQVTAARGEDATPATEGGAAGKDSAGEENPDLLPGSDASLIDAVLSLPPPQRVARIVAMQPAVAEAFFESSRGPKRTALVAGMSPELRETIGALENPERTVVEELIDQRLTRDIYSNAQLQEVMTDFWLNHFNVFLHKNPAMPYYLVSYERDVIRPNALGRFEDLLEGVAHSPAMLAYLDNASSTGPDSAAAERAMLNFRRNPKAGKNRAGLNENYARELMELHTLGVNGGYTQADVIQVARVFTGWTIDRPLVDGQFRFVPDRHEPGTKKVMGRTFKENGEREGRDLLHFLATRPATAHFVCGKLAVRFVSDNPSAGLVNRMAATYLSSGGDISAVLKAMYRSPEFWSTDVYRGKVKTPLEFVVSAVRAANTDVANLRPLANALREMGMPLYGSIPPTGYKWDAADWVSTAALVGRMNFALALAANRLPGITTAWTSPPGAPSPQSEEARLEALLLAGETSQTTRAAMLRLFETQSATTDPAQPVSGDSGLQNRAPTAPERPDRLLAGLLLGSPEFQRR
jgi:uncharacterized protein (DUF1800 family)